MTLAANQYAGMAEISLLLRSVRARVRRARLASAVLATVALTCAPLLLFTIVLGFWPSEAPGWLRLSCSVIVGGAFATGVLWFIAPALLWRPNDAQVARRIEQAAPQAGNDLINSVLLASNEHPGVNTVLVGRAIEEAAFHARRLDVSAAAQTRTIFRWGICALAAGCVFAAMWALAPARLARGLASLMPGEFVPVINSIDLVAMIPGDAQIPAFSRLTIRAEIHNDDHERHSARILIQGQPPRQMQPNENFTSFAIDMGEVEQSFSYRVQIGDSSWPRDRKAYHVFVTSPPRVESLDVTYTFPAYTRMPSRTSTGLTDGRLEAPLGSSAEVAVAISSGPVEARLQIRGKDVEPMRPGEKAGTFVATIPIVENGGYRILVADPSGRIVQSLPDGANGASLGYGDEASIRRDGFFPIVAEDDAPPKIDFVEPIADFTAAPGDKVKLRIRATDKIGLAELVLWGAPEGKDALPVHAFDVAGRTQANVEYTLDLAGKSHGDVLAFFAAGSDERTIQSLGLGPQTQRSSILRVLVKDAKAIAAENERMHREIIERLTAILRAQQSARVDTEICLRQHAGLEQMLPTARRIAQAQQQIQSSLVELAATGPFTQSMAAVRQAVAMLGNNEAREAVAQSAALSRVESLDARVAPARGLAGTQNRIISILEDLLAIMPSLAKVDAAAAESAAATVPPAAAEKLKQLADDLKQYMDEQRRAISAAADLASKPVDSLTSADMQLLHELQAVQDKWEKFMEEALADFSKLAQQDYSNPQLLKELISVRSDITMIKDALGKSAVEIATAIEENGIENAKTLTANIEKWLSDKPDREQWSMEAPLDEMNELTEQPELPTELEDLIGDLLEEEEDIFEEMQDISSQYAGSFDKGAGWDALDGPIVSMNAQGVTGNQLPNSSEISGRSGEGRQGKAVGEYVEDKAVGKGGRRTPTRITHEPFQRGEIRDENTEAPGGATGGGKISGAGGEGLEGPLPPQMKERLEQLAGRQADLVSRGKRFLRGYKVNDYASFKLLSAVTLMDQVGQDMRNYRYNNALRRREAVIESLARSRLAVGSPITVTQDVSSPMPKHVQENMSDARRGRLPEEYREILESYYRRLEQNSK
ncbi:MAG: DUF4175 domain-containing protein [Planctomycetes bacterium]|nr:DUF4175 domain-containing protein [Planctomycetota bacterium]